MVFEDLECRPFSLDIPFTDRRHQTLHLYALASFVGGDDLDFVAIGWWVSIYSIYLKIDLQEVETRNKNDFRFLIFFIVVASGGGGGERW
ncbi:unnamed protein product [Lactuca virosa]|uniref:Uncharacterized protein n=1 Tax=Lactuca virosa TaxID=75947 RepID=A0AAU9M3W7_9ASTR|nr:unnamed protein product [Lactuca virosa]